jgi:hypothetical protein
MTDISTPLLRVLVVATLLLATATLMAAVVSTARAGGMMTASAPDVAVPIAVSLLVK